MNALMFAAKNGISTNNCDLYVTLSPCSSCAKLIIQSGIKKVYYKEMYRDFTGIDILTESGIEVIQL
jgi:dCMP deaminase